MKKDHALPRVFDPTINLLFAGFGLLISFLSVHLSGQEEILSPLLTELIAVFDSSRTAPLVLLASFVSIYVAMFVGRLRVACWLVLAGLIGFACPVAESFVMTISTQSIVIDTMAIIGSHVAMVSLAMGIVWYVFKDEGYATKTSSAP